MPLRANLNQIRRATSPAARPSPRAAADRTRYELARLEQRLMLAAVSGGVAHPDALTGLSAPSISGEVFYDALHSNNVLAGRTTGNIGIPNVEVDLYLNMAAATGSTAPPTVTIVGSAITNAQGNFGFQNLVAGDSYTLNYIAPPGYLIGPEGTSNDDTVNSHAVGDNEVTPIIGTYTPAAVAANTALIDANCGMFTNGVPLPSISGTVFNDVNADGLTDDGDTTNANGQITVGAQPVLAGVTVQLLDPTTDVVDATTTTSATGAYSFTGLTTGSAYLVRFVPNPGYQISQPFEDFVPTGYSWANQSTGIVENPNFPLLDLNNTDVTQTPHPTQTFDIFDDTAQTDVDCGMYAQVITITAASSTIPRPHTAIADETFTVAITPSNTLTANVPYTTVNGTAIAGVDYTAESGVLNFTPGVSVLSFNVPILTRNTPQADVTFTATITPSAAQFPVATSTSALVPHNVTSASCTILNTNFPSVSINNVEAARPTTGIEDFNFTVTLSSTAPFPVAVSYETVDSSAVAGTDYNQLVPGTLAIPAGTLTGTVTVQVLAGTGPTQPKAFLVIVADVTNSALETTAAAAIAEGVGTIESNTPPQLSVAGGQVTESLIGNFLLPFTVTVTPPPVTPVTVNYATSDGSGVAGLDYAATSGSLTFAPGQGSETVNVLAYRRFLSAQDKTVNLTITDPSGTYNVTTATSAGTIHDLATVALPLSSTQRVTYTDYLNNPVTVTLKGPGSGTLVFLGNTSVNTNAYELVLTDTTAASTLGITTRHNLQTSFVNILDDSPLKAITAKSTNILGLVDIAGSLNTLSLDYVQGGTIDVGAGTGTLTVSLVRAVDTSITSAIAIKSLTATSYVDSDGVPDLVTAPTVGPIHVKKGFQGTVVQTAASAALSKSKKAITFNSASVTDASLLDDASVITSLS
jgi:hypothetical protein